MSRLLVSLIVVVVLVIGGLFFFAGRAREKPLVHVEKVVPLANLSN